MLFQALAILLGCVFLAQCRDTSKTIKSIPSITGSLVNLGKMDISFHFNAKDALPNMDSQNSFMLPKSEPLDEPCLCSALRNANNVHSSMNLLNKVLTSNDLFSFNKDPVSSTMCCGSHEHAQEDIVTFEIGPKMIHPSSPVKLPNLPFIFQNFFPRKPMLSSSLSGKPKAVEIFLFPKKHDSAFLPLKKERKDSIQIVGDKELRNDFKSLRFRPSLPISMQSSVKKDLITQEKNETKKPAEKEEEEVETTTVGNSNTI